ncbi:PREDICTED: 23.5 kDa heat shock protein, mitochondrial-like [Camelina sativa]|uniref:23.5 kDa heat shock protein, mitochondrial-like n=1 Tax=Camelina sativa TaxID=90675 RepID=A0ABM0X908_CAMSA|nr:PREDICTED: 23.5 kDa heat shock protein, mitochondrial-like [Camelina sativa]
MASSLALKRLLSFSIVPRSRSVLRPAVSSRLFNTNAVRNYEHGDERNHRSNRHVSRRGGDFFSDMLDPLIPTRSLSQMLNFMDQISEFPLVSAAATRGMGASGVRRGWDVKEKDDALHLRIDMPGLSREDVKLALEQNTLVIKGEGKTEEGDDVSGDEGRRFTSRIGLPEKVYKTDEIKAEMKNGVLKVMIPKIKEDEHNNVRHINVD